MGLGGFVNILKRTSRAAGPTLAEMLKKLENVWRHEIFSRTEGAKGIGYIPNYLSGAQLPSSGGEQASRSEAPLTGALPDVSTSLDAFLASLLLKGVSVGTEVSDESRSSALRVIESLAICYAERLPPNNRLSILVLFAHTLGVILSKPNSAIR